MNEIDVSNLVWEEDEYEQIEDLMAGYALPDVTNILMRKEEWE